MHNRPSNPKMLAPTKSYFKWAPKTSHFKWVAKPNSASKKEYLTKDCEPISAKSNHDEDKKTIKLQELPTCSYTWAGPPSAIDKNDRRLEGHDIDGPIKFAQTAKNSVVFYCLKDYEEYYIDLFENKRNIKNIKVKSIEALADKCFEAKDEFIRSQADFIRNIIEIFKKRGRKKDWVLIKELTSLLILYHGGYALDTNVQPVDEKPFSLPAYSELKVPKTRFNSFDVWLLYAPPCHENIVYAIKKYLESWIKNERNNKIDHTGSILDTIMFGILGPKVDLTQFLGGLGEMFGESLGYNANFLKVDRDEINCVVKDLSVFKTYNNSHVDAYSRANIIHTFIKNKKEKELENYTKVGWSKDDYTELFYIAVCERSIPTIQYLSKQKHHLQDYLNIMDVMLTKTSNAIDTFKNFFDNEEKNRCFSGGYNRFNKLIHLFFDMSMEHHAADYAEFLMQEYTAHSHSMSILKDLCNKHIDTIEKQLSTDNNMDVLNKWKAFVDLQNQKKISSLSSDLPSALTEEHKIVSSDKIDVCNITDSVPLMTPVTALVTTVSVTNTTSSVNMTGSPGLFQKKNKKEELGEESFKNKNSPPF